MERTFIMVKPDGVQRGLIGEIISRFERRGLKLVGMRMLQVSQELASQHYAVHQGKPFYAGLIHRALPNAKIICLRRNPLDGEGGVLDWEQRTLYRSTSERVYA